MLDESERYSIFWPYTISEKPWKHKAYFKMRVEDNSSHKDIAQIEVYNSNGDWINKALTIKSSDFAQPNKYQEFYLDYERTLQWTIEFRIRYLGWSPLYLDHVRNEWIY